MPSKAHAIYILIIINSKKDRRQIHAYNRYPNKKRYLKEKGTEEENKLFGKKLDQVKFGQLNMIPNFVY